MRSAVLVQCPLAGQSPLLAITSFNVLVVRVLGTGAHTQSFFKTT